MLFDTGRTICAGKQPVICPGCRAEYLPDLALLPIITSNQSDGRSIASPNLLKFAFWKVNHDKPMRAIREIKDRLTFRHCCSWAC
jgi:hypothetical protein